MAGIEPTEKEAGVVIGSDSGYFQSGSERGSLSSSSSESRISSCSVNTVPTTVPEESLGFSSDDVLCRVDENFENTKDDQCIVQELEMCPSNKPNDDLVERVSKLEDTKTKDDQFTDDLEKVKIQADRNRDENTYLKGEVARLQMQLDEILKTCHSKEECEAVRRKLEDDMEKMKVQNQDDMEKMKVQNQAENDLLRQQLKQMNECYTELKGRCESSAESNNEEIAKLTDGHKQSADKHCGTDKKICCIEKNVSTQRMDITNLKENARAAKLDSTQRNVEIKAHVRSNTRQINEVEAQQQQDREVTKDIFASFKKDFGTLQSNVGDIQDNVHTHGIQLHNQHTDLEQMRGNAAVGPPVDDGVDVV